MKKKNYWSYLPILCSVENYKDDVSKVIIEFTVGIEGNRNIEVALIGEPNEIHLIRVSVKSFDEQDTFSQKEAEIISASFDHMLAILSMSYDTDITPIQGGDGNRLHVANYAEKPCLNAIIRPTKDLGSHVNGENIAASFCSSLKQRNLIRLVADSQNSAFPMHYKYLCMYKALEEIFKEKGKWKPEFKEKIHMFESDFISLNISNKKLINFIHELRDKCAHAHPGEKNSGIYGLNSEDTKTIRSFTPLFRDIVKISLNSVMSKFGIQFG